MLLFRGVIRTALNPISYLSGHSNAAATRQLVLLLSSGGVAINQNAPINPE